MTARRPAPTGLKRRTLIQAAALAAPFIAQAQGAPVRVGYAIARTGPWAGGWH